MLNPKTKIKFSKPQSFQVRTVRFRDCAISRPHVWNTNSGISPNKFLFEPYQDIEPCQTIRISFLDGGFKYLPFSLLGTWSKNICSRRRPPNSCFFSHVGRMYGRMMSRRTKMFCCWRLAGPCLRCISWTRDKYMKFGFVSVYFF